MRTLFQMIIAAFSALFTALTAPRPCPHGTEGCTHNTCQRCREDWSL